MIWSIICVATIFIWFKFKNWNILKCPSNQTSYPPEYSEDDNNKDSIYRSLKILWRILFPVIQEIKTKKLKCAIVSSVLTVVCGCVFNLLVPVYNQRIAASLIHTTTDKDEAEESPFQLILIYVIFKSFQGEGRLSVLFSLQNILWIPIQHHVSLSIKVHFFQHIHTLGLDWHAKIQTGEILGALDRGTESMTTILQTILFSIVPILTDFSIAIIYLSAVFNPLIGFIIVLQCLFYVFVTNHFTKEKSSFQRDMNEADNLQRQKLVESLQNFEAVKCFANELHESAKYKSAIQGYQKFQTVVEEKIYHLQIVQVFILNMGLLLCSIACAWMIMAERKLGVGDYVLLTTYLSQLYGPMYHLGTYYRILQYKLIELEELYAILQTEPNIVDKPDAGDLLVDQAGVIEFKNVSFGYDANRKLLNNVSFSTSPGKKTAIVGLSGSGKTSILKLILRLYEPDSGEIWIDGTNIRDIRQKSLRNGIGFVPQDAALFSDSFETNIKYGKNDATLTEVKRAARLAWIHKRIESLPDKYSTKVGERGTNLSGGERQRISIARLVLKNAQIVLLDEATSALDKDTNSKVKKSLDLFCGNRTTVVVTHRLSSIMDAHQILVLSNGHFVERGMHSELINQGGVYAKLFLEQQEGRHITNME